MKRAYIIILSIIIFLAIALTFSFFQSDTFSISQLNPISLLGTLAQSIGIGPGDSDSKIEFGITKGGDEELLDIWSDRINRTTMIIYIDFANVEGQSYEDTKAEYHRRVAEAGRNIAYVPIVKTKKPELFEVSSNYLNLTNANNFTVTYDKLRAGLEIRIGWGSVIASSTATSLATEPTMVDKFCIDSQGYYHIAYIAPGDFGGNDVMYGSSTDEGLTWTNVVVQEEGFMYTEWEQAGILCNSTDTIFVTYSGDDGFGSNQAFMRDSSDNFATPTTIIDFTGGFQPGDLSRYSCAINSDSSIHCCGIDNLNGDILYYVNSSDFTTLHGPFTTSSDDSDQCDIELSAGNNEVFIVASGTDQDDLDIFAARDGFTRHQVYDGTNMPNPGREPSIAITPNNDIWITFGDAGDLQLANGTNESLTSWTNQEIDASPSFYMDIALNDRDDIVLTYQTTVSKCAGTLVYALSSDNGVTWKKNRTQLSDRDYACYVALPYSQYPTSNRIYNNVPYIYTSNSTGTFYVYYDNLTIVDAPDIYFVDPTAANGTTTSNTSVTINISIDNAPIIHELIYHWNNSNYTIYNNSLALMFNFNNVSALGESDTSDVAVDVGLHKRNATCYNMGSGCNWAEGKYGSAISFDGVNDYLGITDYKGVTGTAPRTTAFWFKTTDTSTGDNVVISWGGNPFPTLGILYHIGIENGVVWFRAGGTTASGGSGLNDGNFHYVSITNPESANVSDLTFYVDGVNISKTVTGTVVIDTESDINVRIGRGANVDWYFNGVVDEVRLWNYSLSSNEVNQDYMSNLRKFNETQWYLYVNQTQNSTAGLDDGKYNYYGYVKNEYDDSPNSNITDLREITIDTSAPAVTINQPQNQTYGTTTIDFNVTSIDGGGTNSCVYSLNAGLNNNSMTNIGTEWNATNTSMSQGSHTANFYCIDNGGLLNDSEQVTFFIDTLSPDIFFTLPTPANDTTTPNTSVEFNVSIVESDLGEVKWNWNGTNFTIYNDSLITMFNFNNVSALGDSTTTTVDLSLKSNNGICQGNVTVQDCEWDTSGKYGGSLKFNGLNSSVNLTTTGYDNETGTVSMWVKVTAQHIANNDNNFFFDIENPRMAFYVDDTNQKLTLFPISGEFFGPDVTAWAGEWHHVAFTFDFISDEYKIYSDGILNVTSGTARTSGSTISPNMFIGSRFQQIINNFPTNGSIDEVRIWNRVLSEQEMHQLYMTNLRKINETQWYLYVNQSGNSTDELAGTYTYFSSAKDKTGNENKTDTRTINIQADVGPTIDITYPPNNTNTSDTGIDVNYTTTDDIGIDSCWYSNDTYSVNTTLPGCVNITTVVWSEGQHNVTVYVNDTGGNEAQDSVTFTIDSINPDISIVFPINNTNSSDNGLDVNYTVSDINLASCWYSNDTYSVNISLTCGVNITGVTWSEGQHNVTIYANDTFGNQNQSSITFNIHTIPPSFDNLPASQTIYNNQSLSYDVDATSVGVALGTFGINWTSTFSINPISGLLTNVSILAIANYSINISINDTLGNTNYSIFSLEVLNSTIPESDAPTFDNLQNHTQVANISFEFDLDASDPSGIDTFVLNQTNYFSINSTGTITNNTALSQDLIHWLLVTVNDTLGNFATGEFYINITPESPAPPISNVSNVFKIYPSFTNKIPYIKLNEDLKFP